MMERLEVRRPAEGWITLVLLLALGFILAWAIDDPAWVNGHGELTDFLATCAVAGVLVGFAGPKLGWGRWTTHLVGAVFAALAIPILAGQAAQPGASIGQAFHFTAEGSVNAYLDLAWRGLSLTSQEIHYSLVLGIIVWGTMQFASYAVFGHRRPLAAVVVIGLVLAVNMSLTDREQLNYMIAYTGASLFLLIEMHAFDERATWIRRRIGDPSTISALYLRGGTVFIVSAMAVSLLLTNRAASAPLAGAWSGVGDRLVGVGQEISRLLPLGGAVRPLGNLQFGSIARISSRWFSDNKVAFTATVPATFDQKWRAATYDTYQGSGWIQTQSDIASVPVGAGESLLDGTGEAVDPSITDPVDVTVTPSAYGEGLVLAPGAPLTVDQATNVQLFGTDQWFADAELGDRVAGPYHVKAAVLKVANVKAGATEDGITQNKLKVAGQQYPPEIAAKYTDVPPDAMGPYAKQLLADILKVRTGDDPYSIASTMEGYLRSPANGFTYDIDITNVDCGTAGTVECFAQFKRGYCLHFASTMAILLRDAIPGHPIPTRLVQGFLPGTLNGTTDTVQIKDAHAWVEVYFPNYGWIPFDPTKNVGQPATLPVGNVVAPPSQLPALSFGPDDSDPRLGPGAENGGKLPPGPAAGGGGGADRSLLIVLSIILAAGVLGLAFAAWLRGPRGEVSPDTAWRTLSRTASRFGFAPRPTQTIYEYATSLGELVPVAQHDIETIATAKVETSYAAMRIGGARLDAVRDATRRLRISLLRLAFRRPRRRRRT